MMVESCRVPRYNRVMPKHFDLLAAVASKWLPSVKNFMHKARLFDFPYRATEVLPNGGEMRPLNRERMPTVPIAVPANCPTPSNSMVVVMKTAMKPSRNIPAMSTAIQIIEPLTVDNNPVPVTIITVPMSRMVFRERSRSESRAMGMAQIRLMVWKADNAPSALASAQPISRK